MPVRADARRRDRVTARGAGREARLGTSFSSQWSKGTDEQQEESLFASPLLLAELGRTFLRFDPVDLLAEGEMELDEFLDKYQRSTVEKLGLYYFLLVRDVANKVGSSSCLRPSLTQSEQTGIRSTASVSAANEHFVNPLRRHATAWSAVLEIELAQDGAAAELFQQRMELELVVGSLRRVEEALAAS